MATTKGGFNINPRLPRTPEPTSNKHGNAKWGTGRGSGRVASRFLKGRSSLSMKDVMSMAAEAAQRADAQRAEAQIASMGGGGRDEAKPT